jgi:hypothetical protein
MEHRYVWEQVNGPIPDGYEIHHINRKTQDNCIENLQLRVVSEHRQYHHVKRGICSIFGCELPHKGSGLCKKHWYRVKRTGSPYGLMGHSSTNPLCIV